LKLTEIQQQEEAAKKQAGGEHHAVDSNQPSLSGRSFQLKNLLGVGGKEKGWTAPSNQQGGASSASLRDIQVEQERLSQEAAAQQPRPTSGPPATPQQLPLSSQWKAPVGQAKSFTEIIEEEKLAAAAAGLSQGGEVVKAAKGGSWAAKAGGSKVLETGIPAAWVAGQAQVSESSDPTPSAAAAAGGKSTARRVVAATPAAASGTGAPKTIQQQPQPAVAAAAKKGASVSASNSDSIVDWSVQQLKRFAGEDKQQRDDPALIEFCLTLKSAVEIREYLADYLGSTPQVPSCLCFTFSLSVSLSPSLCLCLSLSPSVSLPLSVSVSLSPSLSPLSLSISLCVSLCLSLSLSFPRLSVSLCLCLSLVSLSLSLPVSLSLSR
jgi:hypothetical protein